MVNRLSKRPLKRVTLEQIRVVMYRVFELAARVSVENVPGPTEGAPRGNTAAMIDLGEHSGVLNVCLPVRSGGDGIGVCERERAKDSREAGFPRDLCLFNELSIPPMPGAPCSFGVEALLLIALSLKRGD